MGSYRNYLELPNNLITFHSVWAFKLREHSEIEISNVNFVKCRTWIWNSLNAENERNLLSCLWHFHYSSMENSVSGKSISPPQHYCLQNKHCHKLNHKTDNKMLSEIIDEIIFDCNIECGRVFAIQCMIEHNLVAIFPFTFQCLRCSFNSLVKAANALNSMQCN